MAAVQHDKVLVLGGDAGHIWDTQGQRQIDGHAVYGAVEELVLKLRDLGLAADRIHPLQPGPGGYTADNIARVFDHLQPGGMHAQEMQREIALADGAEAVLMILPASAPAWCALGMTWQSARLGNRGAFRLAFYVPTIDPLIGLACPRLFAAASIVSSDLNRIIAWLRREPPALPFASQN